MALEIENRSEYALDMPMVRMVSFWPLAVVLMTIVCLFSLVPDRTNAYYEELPAGMSANTELTRPPSNKTLAFN